MNEDCKATKARRRNVGRCCSSRLCVFCGIPYRGRCGLYK